MSDKAEQIANLESALASARQRVAELEQAAAAHARVRQDLREHKERLAETQRMAKIGAFHWTLATGEITMSPELRNILRYDELEEMTHNRAGRILHHPEEVAGIDAWLKQAFESDSSRLPPREYRVISKDGKPIVIHTEGIIERDPDTGKPVAVFGFSQDVTARKATEAKIAENEFMFRALYELSPVGIALNRMSDGQFLEGNTALFEASGYTEEEFKSLTYWDLTPRAYAPQEEIALQSLKEHGRYGPYEKEYIRKDGSRYPVVLHGRLITNANGESLIYSIVQDVSERKEAETAQRALQAQLLHAHKMESIGRLAGGVAHDFNNMLSVIIGNTEISLTALNPSEDLRETLSEIDQAARRSAELTRQLLGFARRQTAIPEVLDLNSSISGMLKMIERLIGEQIYLNWLPGKEIWPTQIDPNQLSQILVNLCINSRDAVEPGGHIQITTRNHVISENSAPARQSDPGLGEFVELRVTDNGAGISASVITHIFEPFYSTKDASRGTGLGLATVYGIAKQNGGTVLVTSEEGKGAAFTVLFPRCDRAPSTATPAPLAPPSINNAHETILLVEDESTVLKVTARMLTTAGYQVHSAQTSLQAHELIKQESSGIDLLLSDVILPEISGPQLANQLRRHIPDLRCLFMSGYTADALSSADNWNETTHFIAKPFTKPELLKKIQSTLDSAAPATDFEI